VIHALSHARLSIWVYSSNGGRNVFVTLIIS
jgi:hypothetical protein